MRYTHPVKERHLIRILNICKFEVCSKGYKNDLRLVCMLFSFFIFYFLFFSLLFILITCQHYFLTKITHRYVQLKQLVFLAKKGENNSHWTRLYRFTTGNLFITNQKLDYEQLPIFLWDSKAGEPHEWARKLLPLLARLASFIVRKRKKALHIVYSNNCNANLLGFFIYSLESRWLLLKQGFLSSSSQCSMWRW